MEPDLAITTREQTISPLVSSTTSSATIPFFVATSRKNPTSTARATVLKCHSSWEKILKDSLSRQAWFQ